MVVVNLASKQLRSSMVSRPCRHRTRSVPAVGHVTRARLVTPVRNVAAGTHGKLAEKNKGYNSQMNKMMGWENGGNPFEYNFDRGLYYHEIDRGLICGSQPRNAADVEFLHNEEGVTTIVSMQQDKDAAYWGVNLDEVYRKAHELGMKVVRRPARDFDPNSLRYSLPGAVSAINHTLENQGRAYVHCTAGLGRAPAVVIAFLYWFRNFQNLDEAYQHLTSIRPCGPKRDAIRGATYDMLKAGDWERFYSLPADAFAYLDDGTKHRLRSRVLELDHS